MKKKIPHSLLIFMIRIVIFILCSFYPLPANEFRFSHLSMEDGLSNNSVYKILQDSKGFMWFATFSGLNRFDGMNFTVFKPEASSPYSISSSVIFELFEDSQGNIWIGTDGGSLNKYDYKNNHFIHYAKKTDQNGISSEQINAINEDRQGNIWIGTAGGGISILDRQQMLFSRFSMHDPANGLESNTIRCIFRDSNDRMWIGTEAGGLSYYDEERKFFHTYRHDPQHKNSLSSDVVRTLFEDTAGTLWIGTEGGGLLRFNRQQELFQRVALKGARSVRSINQDEYGRLWIGTEGNGIYIFHPDEMKIQHLVSSRSNRDSLSNDKIRSIYIDRSGIIWIGTRGGGINKYNTRKKKFKLYNDNMTNGLSLTSNNIRQIYEDSERKIWVCTDGGGVNLIKDGTIIRAFNSKPGQTGSLNSNHVFSVVEDSRGYIWFGTEGGGLNRYNPRTGKFKYYLHDPQDQASISSNVVWSLYEDQNRNLWVGTEGGGLNRFDRKNETFIHYKYDPDDNRSLIGSSVHAICQDSKGRLWIGTWDGGISLYQPDHTFKQFKRDPYNPNTLSDSSINCIVEDQQQRIWIGTGGGGLNLFIEEDQSFIHYTARDGLAGDNVFGILDDHNGNLWISTDNGLSKFNPYLASFINYSQEDGLQKDEFTYNAFLKTAAGEFYFGGTNGISSFYPARIIENTPSSDITITAIKILDLNASSRHKTLPGSYQVFWPHELKSLEFPSKSLVSIEFALLDFTAPERNRYAVLLEEYNSDWQPLGTQNHITYSNLPPGKYTFRIKGANSKGIWSENKEQLNLIVLPPFYQTRFFFALVFLLSLSAVFSIYRMRTLSLKRQNRNLREYASHIVKAREEERKNVAREVHDELGQILTVLKMDLYWLKSHLDQEKEVLIEKVGNTLDIANISLESIKRLSARLRPNVLDNLSLPQAVKWLVDDFSRHMTGIRYKVSFSEYTFPIDQETKTSIFRIVQELLTNIIRHSKATIVEVKLTYLQEELIMQVYDNGIGLEQEKIYAKNSFGIIGIRERCDSLTAKLAIESFQNEGTMVTVKIPFPKDYK